MVLAGAVGASLGPGASTHGAGAAQLRAHLALESGGHNLGGQVQVCAQVLNALVGQVPGIVENIRKTILCFQQI